MSAEVSMANYYAARAGDYERIYQKPERQTELRTLRELIETTFAATNVFELACGTGYWTEILARCAATVTATDFNDQVLQIARAKPLEGNDVTFQQADAYALPQYARKFNAGHAAFWWSHVPRMRLRSFLQSFHALFEPGARIVFMDNCYVPGSSTPISHTDAHGNTHQLRRLQNGSVHDVIKNFPTETELRAAVNELAHDVDVQFLRYYWTLSYRVAPFLSS